MLQLRSWIWRVGFRVKAISENSFPARTAQTTRPGGYVSDMDRPRKWDKRLGKFTALVLFENQMIFIKDS